MQAKIEIRAKDGKRIWISIYLPAKGNNKVMIVAPGGGLTKEYYDPLAYFFQQHNYTVITFDYRGVGSSISKQVRDSTVNIHQWAVQDIDAVILFVKNTFPQQEIIYVGHCIGGEIVGLAQASQYISRLVLVNSALSCKKLWPLKDRILVGGLQTVIRGLSKLFGYFPGRRVGISGDLPKGVMRQWINWCNNSNGLFDIFPDNNYRKLQVPLLAFSFSDDWHCPPKAVEGLLNHFSNSIITWHHLRPQDIGIRKIGYSGFFEPLMKTMLWIKMLKWLNEEDTESNYPSGVMIVQNDDD